MWNAMMFAINSAWKVLGLAGAWMLFKYLIHDGKSTLEDLFDTAGMAIKAGCMTLKRWLWERIKKESKGPVKAEGSVE